MLDQRENPFLAKVASQKKQVMVKGEAIDIASPFSTVFKEYENRAVIAEKIAKDFIADGNAYRMFKGGYDPEDLRLYDYNKIIDNGLTFFMSSQVKRTGLLSLCPALAAGLKLYSDLPAGDLKTNFLNALKSSLEAMLKIIYRTNGDWREAFKSNKNPVFDASPYLTNDADADDTEFYAGTNADGLDGKSYIDSISWAVPVFLRVVNLSQEIEVEETVKPKKGQTKKTDKADKKIVKKEEYVFDDVTRNACKKLAKWCLVYVNSVALKAQDEDQYGVYDRPKGWGFTKMESASQKVRSLYFTYAASSIYASFYNEYRKSIEAFLWLNIAQSKDAKQNILNEKVFGLGEDYEQEYAVGKGKKVATDSKALIKLEDRLSDANDEKIKEFLLEIDKSFKFLHDPESFEGIATFLEFNDNKSIGYEGKEYSIEEVKNLGPLAELRWSLEKISNEVWENVQKDDKLENNFLHTNFDFGVADVASIKQGGQTNSLYSGLLAIGIILNSGYDVVIRNKSSKANDLFGQKAYEDMQDAFLAHTQKVQRFFDKLLKEGLAFAVDALILRFPEDYSLEATSGDNSNDTEKVKLSNKVLAEKLRKQSIQICSLTPMLLKTNNMVSRLIVRYPQKQMGESLEEIANSRFYDSKKKGHRWIWETDEYQSMTNYYYVSAVYDFYAYYDRYEAVYLKRFQDFENAVLSEKNLALTPAIVEYRQKIKEEKESTIEAVTSEMQAKIDELDREKRIAEQKAIEAKNINKAAVAIVENIESIVRDSEYFKSSEFIAKLVGGIRQELAKELAERFSHAPLAGVSETKDNSLLSLLEAMLADIMFPAAVSSIGSKISLENEQLGVGQKMGEAGKVIKQYNQKLVQDKQIEKIFANIFKQHTWE